MLDIQRKLVKYNFSARKAQPTYIVIHDTGNPGAGALNHFNYFNGGNRNSSADYFVDSNNIIQIIDTEHYYSWAVGDGNGKYGITNSNSVSIEMCLEKDGYPSQATIRNTIDLTKYLMDKYNIGINRVVRHFDASRKSCPNSFKSNNWAKWTSFKNALTNDISNSSSNESNSTITNTSSSMGCIQGYNAIIKNDFFYLRDSNGNKTSGIIEIGTKIKVLDVSYSKQLVYITYLENNKEKKAYITNATNCIEYLYQDQWRNGSTTEIVYETSNSANSIGSINPYEKATSLYRENGILHVVYSTAKGINTKSGYVKYNGGFNKF